MTAAAIIAELDTRDLLEPASKIAKAHHVTLSEMLGTSRFRPAVQARHEFWAYLHTELGWPYSCVGKVCKVNHVSVMKGIAKHEASKRPGIVLVHPQPAAKESA